VQAYRTLWFGRIGILDNEIVIASPFEVTLEPFDLILNP